MELKELAMNEEEEEGLVFFFSSLFLSVGTYYLPTSSFFGWTYISKKRN